MMKLNRVHPIIPIIVSILLAYIFTIIPVPYDLHWYKPEILSLMIIFWVITQQKYFGIGSAWFIGFIMDGLKGDLLGQTAIAMTIVAYLAQLLQYRILLQPFWHKAICILVLVGFGQLTLVVIRMLIGFPPQTPLVWLSTLTSVLIWPFVFRLLSIYGRPAFD